jgi:hypothetical protein
VSRERLQGAAAGGGGVGAIALVVDGVRGYLDGERAATGFGDEYQRSMGGAASTTVGLGGIGGTYEFTTGDCVGLRGKHDGNATGITVRAATVTIVKP